MVATGEGKDRHRATTRKLLLMPRQVHAPGWVVWPGWQGPAAERRQAAAADGAWPVSTVVLGVERAPGPVWVSRVRNVETLLWVRISGAGMRRRCGKPTVRGAEFPGRTGCSRSGCRQLKGSRKSGAAGPGTPPGWSLHNWPDTGPVLGSERTLTWAGEPYLFRPAGATSPFSPGLTGSWPAEGTPHSPPCPLIAAWFARTAGRVKGRDREATPQGALDVVGGEPDDQAAGGGEARRNPAGLAGLGAGVPPGCQGGGG